MTSSLPIPHNPYVGPRPFVRGETLYGRDTDLRKLINLLVAERIVLLCAPSGAGKTSLIQAALIPRLEARDFQVLPNIRVNAETPIPGLNRYVASTLQSLEERRPVEEQLSLDELGTLSIAAYLTRRGMDDSVVLIFDQFEEVLTADLADREAKHTYFVQLGEALRNRGRWALFAIREDYLAALQPYARPIPTQLGTVFRLDLLEADAARQAIQRPALAAGVAFADDAATRLIDDLRRVRVQRMEGVIEDQLGPYVEPVQLQVVCLRLWAGLPPEAEAITVADLGVVGDVDSALRQYYADQMQAIAGASGVREGIIRDWCERLISEQGFRTQVAQGARATDGLDNAVIQRLIDAHLLRAEPRRGLTWFELTHDRLVGPIQSDNVAWRDANLSPLQQQARLWERQQRPEGLLLRGEALAQAEGWARANAETLAPAEREYLIACQVAHAAAERERRDARRIRSLLVGVVVALVIALGLAGLAFALYSNSQEQTSLAQTAEAQANVQKQMAEDAQANAETQRQTAVAAQANAESQLANANAQRLAAQAMEVPEYAPQRGLLLALEALRQTSSPISAADQSLRDLLTVIGGLPFRGHEGPIYTLAFSPDGRTLATGSWDGTARLWRVDQPDTAPTVLRGHEESVMTLAFSPDGRTLATGSDDGTVRLWQVDQPEVAPTILRGHEGYISTLAFSPDGRTLATGSGDTTARLWTVDQPDATPRVLSGHGEHIAMLAFSPDGRILATGSWDGTARLWQVDQPDAAPIVLRGHEGPIRTLAFSPDGRTLATGSGDNTARLWQVNQPEAAPIVLRGHEDSVVMLAFSPDGRTLATGSKDNTARLWQVNQPEAAPTVLRGHEGPVVMLAFSPDGRSLATGSEDGTARLWQVGQTEAAPIVLRGHEYPVVTLAFSPDGRILATGSWDGTARLWHGDQPEATPTVLRGHKEKISTLAFSPDGRTLATGSSDGTARLWKVDQPDTAPTVLRGHEYPVLTLAFSPDGRTLATGSKDNTARLWQVNQPDTAPTVLRGHENDVVTLAFSPDGRTLATGSWDNTARLWQVNQPEATPIVLRGHEHPVVTLAFSPDGRTLATGCDDNTARLWQVNQPEVAPTVLRGHEYPVLTLAFNPDGRTLATGSGDNTARLWQVNQPEAAPIVLRGHEDSVVMLAFSPDGRTLATGSADGTARLWQVDQPEAVPTVLRGHEGSIWTLAFSPDGRTLATGSGDGTVRLWQVAQPDATPTVLRGLEGAINTLAFSPDGRTLATGSSDGTARLWTTQISDLENLACAVLSRNLNWDEWQQYFGLDVPYRQTCPNLPIHPSLARPKVDLVATLVQKGELDRALSTYQQAQQIDPTLAPPAAWLVGVAANMVADHPGTAITAYEYARQIDSLLEGTDARTLNTLCWYGSIAGHAAVVLDACERAVALAPDDGGIRDSRGLARALTGNSSGAIEDFQAYIVWANQNGSGDHIPQRQDWIESLKAGRNPFDAQTLEQLKSQ